MKSKLVLKGKSQKFDESSMKLSYVAVEYSAGIQNDLSQDILILKYKDIPFYLTGFTKENPDDFTYKISVGSDKGRTLRVSSYGIVQRFVKNDSLTLIQDAYYALMDKLPDIVSEMNLGSYSRSNISKGAVDKKHINNNPMKIITI